MRGLGAAADQHDAAEQITAAAVIATAGLPDGFEDGEVKGHEGDGAVNEIGVGERSVRRGTVAVFIAVHLIGGGLRGANFLGWWRTRRRRSWSSF